MEDLDVETVDAECHDVSCEDLKGILFVKHREVPALQ
jgi:hypothetical protein